jgi:hypothetical protein
MAFRPDEDSSFEFQTGSMEREQYCSFGGDDTLASFKLRENAISECRDLQGYGKKLPMKIGGE